MTQEDFTISAIYSFLVRWTQISEGSFSECFLNSNLIIEDLYIFFYGKFEISQNSNANNRYFFLIFFFQTKKIVSVILLNQKQILCLCLAVVK